MKLGDDQRIKEDAFIPSPQATRNTISREAGIEAFQRVQEQLNKGIFRRPEVVQAHWMQHKGCHCDACDEYFEEGKFSEEG